MIMNVSVGSRSCARLPIFNALAGWALLAVVATCLSACGGDSGGGGGGSGSSSSSGGTSTYTIGGSVSGLTADGLQLTDGVDQLNVAANATTYQFPTALATGKSYAVTPTGQPKGFTVLCSVTGGTGTVGTANVSVPVTCRPAVAGVSSLAGSSFGGMSPLGAALDTAGNLYIADFAYNLIRKVTPSGVATVLAGSGVPGHADGTGSAASFNGPTGLAVDASGNVYVADGLNNEIRRITPAGVVTTLAGSTVAGRTDGTGNAASFHYPFGVALDSAGNVYVADGDNNSIRKVTSAGVVTTFAGSTAGTGGTLDGTGTAAQFNAPTGIAADGLGNLYVADYGNNEIRAIHIATAAVVTLSGSPAAGDTNGPIASASFNEPYAVAVNAAGDTLFVADKLNNQIRMITLTGTASVSTLAGSGVAGHADGAAASASFSGPTGVVVDAGGEVLVADYGNASIRKVTSAGQVSTIFQGSAGYLDGTGSAAAFNAPYSIAVDSSGNTFVADTFNNAIRKVTPAGVVTTFAGGAAAGHADGTGTAASFSAPTGIAIDSAGTLYVADSSNNEIRKVTSAGVVSTLAGSPTAGSADGTGSAAGFSSPNGVAVDGMGNVYVADYGNNEIRMVTSAGVVTTLAGSTTPGSTDGTGTAASFNQPFAIALDKSGNLFVSDYNNNEIREVTAGGVVTTFAGSTTSGSADGTGTKASFYKPLGVAFDSTGNLYVADFGNNEIRKVTAAGVVSTLAGTTTPGNAAGAGVAAGFDTPSGVAVDSAGNLYVSEIGNNDIRKLIAQ